MREQIERLIADLEKRAVEYERLGFEATEMFEVARYMAKATATYEAITRVYIILGVPSCVSAEKGTVTRGDDSERS
jgi:hypothetical protein